VINCSGIGARDLVPDPELIPVRGQLVVIANPGITEFFSEDTGTSPNLLHYTPHGDTVILGGTAQPGLWSREPDPATADAIITRCALIEPRLRHSRILEHRVGLRPTRPHIRLEQQKLDDTRIIHNYGHGGAGVTVSWGCADEVAALTR
jgi:D-amino-acid oxidase